MSTLLLPADEIAKLRVMKGLAYTLAVMITLDRHYPGRAFRPDQVAMVAGIDVRTASKQLQDLSTLDRVILSKGGYVLTQGGRALFLAPAVEEALALSPENSQALEVQALDVNVQFSESAESASSTHTACALLKKKEEVDSFSNLKTDSPSSSEIKSAQTLCADGEWPTVREILEATPDLFGEPGVLAHGLALESITPWMALGWIAHAWDQWVDGGRHGNLNAPAGVVHNRLKSGQKPRPIYYNNGWEILPDGFMESLGLRTYSCGACGEKFPKSADLAKHESLMFICEHGCDDHFHTLKQADAHYAAKHPRSAEAIGLSPLDDEHDGYIAWVEVKERLQVEMNRASYDNWVSHTQAVAFDAGELLTVGACNSFGRDWLENRLTDTVQKLLAEILKADINVRFIVADVGGYQ